jgi:hypothetical protein
MPDGMRPRIEIYAEKKFISMNSAFVEGMDSFLDNHEELQTLIAAVKLLKEKLQADSRDVEDLKIQLEKKLGNQDIPDPTSDSHD